MANYKTLATVFIVLTLVFAGSTGYLLAVPNTAPSKGTTTITTASQIVTQTATVTASQNGTSQPASTPPTTVTTTVTGSSQAPSSQSLGLAFAQPVGAYLTNASGWTLYLFLKDVPNNGTSACNGGCAKTWPPFYAAGSASVPRGLNASSLGTITRADGSKQSTYNGWPLYYYSADKKAGDTNGEGVGTVWFVASPSTQVSSQIVASPLYTMGIAYKPSTGEYLTNSSGWTIYVFAKDVPNNGTSACNGGCAKTWPPFYVGTFRAVPGFNSSLFGTITRADGSKQSTYNGHPLYYYAPDKNQGDTNGQGVGGVWFVCSLPVPKLSAPTTTTSTTASATRTTTTTSLSISTAGLKVSIPNGTSTNQNSPGYTPNAITVVVGVNNTVTWTNNDAAIHTVTSTGVPPSAQAFDSGNMNPGSAFSQTFTVPGTYQYHCVYHSWMKGTIIVKSG